MQPAVHANIPAEYHALTNGAGLVDRSDLGRLCVVGPDGRDLLNRLTTNRLEHLPEGASVTTVLTTPKGRVVDVLTVGALGGALLCLTSPGRSVAVAEWIDYYVFGEEVTVEVLTERTAQFTVAGPQAGRVLAGVTGVGELLPGMLQTATVGGVGTTVWRGLGFGVDAWEVLVAVGQAAAVWDALAAMGPVPVGSTAWEAMRVVSGVPAYGAEFGDHTNPLETRLRGSISFTKGCYTGQEVIARLNTYNKVQRSLMAVELASPSPAGATLLDDEVRVGTLTSVAAEPGTSRIAGLALVDTRSAVPGKRLQTWEGVPLVLADPAYALATEMAH